MVREGGREGGGEEDADFVTKVHPLPAASTSLYFHRITIQEVSKGDTTCHDNPSLNQIPCSTGEEVSTILHFILCCLAEGRSCLHRIN